MKTKNVILRISFIAIISALIFIATAFITIPYAGGIGYFNVSDGLIMFSTIYLGPIVGICSAIIGCSFGDLYAGFANCIPFTILAKSLEAIAIFLLYNLLSKTKYIKYISFFISPLFMVLGYIPYYLIYDDGKGALALLSSLFDLIQGIAGGVIGIALHQMLSKVRLPSYYKKETIIKLKTSSKIDNESEHKDNNWY